MRTENYIRQAKTYLAQNKRTEAIAICERTIAEQPDSAIAYITLGEALEAQGDLNGAWKAYLKALELQPQLVEAHAYLAQLYSECRWLDEAVYHYQQAISFKPDWPELHYNLGNTLHKLGDLPGAIRSYQQAIALKPNYIGAYFNLGVVLGENNQLDAAAQTYRQTIVLAPQNVKAYNNLGYVLIRQDKLEEAIAVYQQAIEIQPDWATLHNNLGQILFEKDPSAAIASYNRAIELQPDMVLAHYNLGKAWQLQGNHEVAISYFQQVLTLDPDRIAACTDCGFSLMAIGKLAEAMTYFRQAIAIKPAFVEAYCYQTDREFATGWPEGDELALASIRASQFVKALMATEPDPSQLDRPFSVAEVEYYLAQTYQHLGNASLQYGLYESAIVYYHKALQLQPKNSDLYWMLGNSLAKKKRLNAAIIAYHLGLAIQDDNPQIYFLLGKALEKQQQWKQAIAYYQKALQLQEKPGKKGINLVVIDTYFESDNSTYLPLPKGIYLSSWDWIYQTQIEGNEYVEIVWKRVETTPPPRQLANSEVTLTNSKLECGGISCAPCLKRISQWFDPIHVGWGVHILSQPQTIPAVDPKTFVAQISNGRAWIVPKKNYWMVCQAIAIITPDNYLLADISRNYPDALPGCNALDPKKHIVFKLESLPHLEKIDGSVAVLSGLSGNVYFHWMVDVLPRIELLQRGEIDLGQIDYFLVNSCQQSFQRETLAALGIPEAKILESDRHSHIQAKQLIVPSFPGYFGWPPRWAIDFLRRKFLPTSLPTIPYPERIYISRNKAKHRRVLNENEVLDCLSQYGFVEIFPETLSVAEQVAIFFHAKVIVAPHGSGLTNIIFCQPGTKVIELMSPHYIGHYYWGISHYLKLEHYYLTGEPFECYPIRQLMYQNPLTEDILINLSSLKKMIEVARLHL